MYNELQLRPKTKSCKKPKADGVPNVRGGEQRMQYGAKRMTFDHTGKKMCPICMDSVTKPSMLPKCKHVFCIDCIKHAFEYDPVCPVCGESYHKRAPVSVTGAANHKSSAKSTDGRCAICLDDVKEPYSLPKCKHVFCTECINHAFEYDPVCPVCGEQYGKRSPAVASADVKVKSAADRPKHRFCESDGNSADLCAICLDAVTKPFTLSKCKHVFCTECINHAFEYKPICPSCGFSYGKRFGNQPQNGKMTVRYDASELPGYDKYGTIVINYDFPSGIQTVIVLLLSVMSLLSLIQIPYIS